MFTGVANSGYPYSFCPIRISQRWEILITRVLWWDRTDFAREVLAALAMSEQKPDGTFQLTLEELGLTKDAEFEVRMRRRGGVRHDAKDKSDGQVFEIASHANMSACHIRTWQRFVEAQMQKRTELIETEVMKF